MAITLNDLPPAAVVADPSPAPDLTAGIPQSVSIDTSHFGESPWDVEQRAADEAEATWQTSAREQIYQVALDPDSYFKGKDLGFTADPEFSKKMALNSAFMEFESNGPVSLAESDLQRKMTRQDIAIRRFEGRGAESEEAFHAEIVKDATRRKDGKALAQELVVTAFDDAMLPGDKAPGFAAWRAAAKGKPGYDPAREADYLEAWEETRRAAAERVEAFRPELVNVWRAFRMKGNITAEAYKAWQGIEPEHRGDFLDALAIRAKALPEEERATFWANMQKVTGQIVADYGRAAGEAATSAGLAGVSVSPYARTVEEYAQRREDVSEFRAGRNFAADVRRIFREDYDPLKSAFLENGKPGFWEGVAYQVPGVTGTSLTMAVPVVGVAMMALSMEGQAYESMRGRLLASGMDDQQASDYAEGLAPLVAAPQVALEKVGFGIWSRKLPGFTKALDAIGDRITNRALRFGVKAGTIATAETGVELIQDATSYAVQDIAAALTEDIPDVDWKSVLGESWASAPEIFATMLPLAILGAAGGLSAESRRAAFAQSSPVERRALGISDAASAAMDAAAGKGPASLNAAVQAAWDTRTPDSPEAKAAVEELKAAQASQAAAARELEKLGYAAPRFVVSEEGILIIDSASGEEIGQAPDLAGAIRIARTHTVALDDLETDQVAALGSLFLAARAAVELDPASVQELAFGETFDPEKASPEMAARFAAQVALKEQAEGGSGNIARSVLGYSVTSFAQGMRTTINKLFRGASVTDVFHETFHGLRRQARAAGTLTREHEIAMLRALDTVLAGRTTKDGTALRFIPDGMADADISETLLDEALSEIGEMELLRTRKGKGKGKLGITRGVISRNLTALAKLAPGAVATFKSFMDAVRARWGLSLSRAIALKKAERDGKFDAAGYDAFLNKLLGLDEQQEHDDGVKAELDRILGLPNELADDDIPFSIGNINFTPGGGSKTVTIQDTTIDFGISSDGQTGEIILVKTPRNKRRQGSATAALTEFIKQADLRQLTLFLTPEPMDKGVSKSGLEDLYKSLGFRANKGSKKDFRSIAAMVRDPQQPEGGSFSLGRAPAVWESFPDVQWLVPFGSVSNTGGPRIKVPDSKFGERAYNRDWYVAKGKLDASTPDEQHKAARELIHRIVTAAPRANLDSMRDFLRAHPQAEIVPVRGLEAPNKHANVIPENFARFLSLVGGQHVSDTIHKTNTSHNTGKSAWDRLQQIHSFEGEVISGAEYIIVDDISTSGATTYYLARHIAAQGGIVVGSVQMGLTPRGEKNRWNQRAMVGDEQVLSMSDTTRKGLQAKGDNASINAVVQALGIAYDWRTLTDALARALTGNWSKAKNLAGVSGQRGSLHEGIPGGRSADTGITGSLPAFAGEIEAAGQVQPPQGTLGFSLGPANVADIMAGNALARVKDPIRRAQAMSRMARDFQSIRMETERALMLSKVKRGKGEMKREAAIMEEMLAEQYENEAYARHYGILSNDDLTKIKSQPAHELLATTRPDGSVDPFRGRLMSKKAWMEKFANSLWDTRTAGDYDGSEGLARHVFGGQITPSQAAKELFEAHIIKENSVDAVWEILHQEQATVSTMKEALGKAKEDIRQAKIQAKQEANEWLAKQVGDQQSNFSAKEEIIRSLRMLDAILLALPPEIRGKLGGATQMARIGSDELRLEFLKEKIGKADAELEIYLKQQFGREFEALLKQTKPERDEAGKKPKGKIGANVHDLFRAVEEAMSLDGRGVLMMIAAREAVLADPDANLSAEEEQHLRNEIGMINLAGNWTKADAARREAALMEGTRLYFGGYQQAKIEASAKRAARQDRRADLKKATGKSGKRMERVAREVSDKGTKIGRTKQTILSLFSFPQLVKTIFGENSDTAKLLIEWERRASIAKDDAVQAAMDGMDGLFSRLAGGAVKGEALRWKMAQPGAITVDLATGPEAFSEMEAISVTLMWMQEDGQRHMTGHLDENDKPVGEWHWTQADVDALEAKLSPEARQVRFWLMDQYGREYDRLNEVFRSLYGVNMPRHKLYSPITVAPAQACGGQLADPVSGTMTGPSLTPGSLRNRSQTAVAEPKFRDATQLYIAHTKQMEHWMAYAPFSTEAMAVINSREVGNSVEAAAGAEALNVLRGWVDYFAQGGTRDAAAHLAGNQLLSRMLGRLSAAALVGRVGVLVIQSTQLGAAAYEMPVGTYLKQFAKLMTGRLDWGTAIRSEYIQRRMRIMPPSVQEAMKGLMSSKPNRVKSAARSMGRLISGADALFTAGTFAMVYDWQLAQNGGDAVAARAEAERITDSVAQPVRAGERSLFEVTGTNPAVRVLWAFASEARQKVAITAYALSKKSKAEKAKGILVTWALSGVLSTVIRAVMRDLRSDEDDEWLDERNWNPARLGLMSITGPLGGLPIVGKEIEAALFGAAGVWAPQGSLLSAPGKAAETLTTLPDYFQGEKDFADALKDAETILTGIAPASDTASALSSFSHVIRDLYGIADNLLD